mmetsp:Transcript_18724/g.34685  ORF Transcript_18724/g.34685 Transcript_18724/m.34685 type:complete len:327 (+) Transcript_18724:69-1049(+)
MEKMSDLPETPLVASSALSAVFGAASVDLKMETSQPTGSFKDRGMSRLVSKYKAAGKTRIVSSSGGNAGMAAAHAARSNGMEAVICVPQTTKSLVVSRLRALGAEVEVIGENWNAADLRARELCSNENTGYTHPFDNPELWKGHSGLVDELVAQRNGKAPDAIFVSVGGGGLIAGVLHGLQRAGGEWMSKTKVIAAETKGAASMHAAMEAKSLVKLDKITTLATTLGALQVSEDALNFALSHPAGCESVVVSDLDAVEACELLLNEHRVLVEPSCGAAIAASKWYCSQPGHENLDVVVVVCGGSGITLDLLIEYKKRALEQPDGTA